MDRDSNPQASRVSAGIPSLPSRRSFLKSSTALASAGLLAGCTGGDGSSGGSGDGGDGTAMGSPGDEPNAPEQIGFLAGAGGIPTIIADYVWEQTDNLENAMEEVGVEEVVFGSSFEDVSLFAAGQADFTIPSLQEAAIIGSRREVDITIHAQLQQDYATSFTKPGSQYDVANTGGPEETYNLLAETGDLFGFADWGGFIAHNMLMIMDSWGIEFTQDSSDIEVRELGYGGSVTQALLRDQVSVNLASISSGGGPPYMNGEISHVFDTANVMHDLGYGRPPAGVIASRTGFYEQYPEVVNAFLRVYTDAIDWFMTDTVEKARTTEWWWPELGVESADEAQYVIEYLLLAEHDMQFPTVYEDFLFTEDLTNTYTAFLDDTAATFDGEVVPEDWADWVTIEAHSDIS